jgi:hypothetical protein
MEDRAAELIDELEHAVADEDPKAAALALAIVAARLVRGADGSKEDFSEMCGSAWGIRKA